MPYVGFSSVANQANTTAGVALDVNAQVTTALSLGLGVGGEGASSLYIDPAIAILRKYGTDAHVYLPGIGVINGLTAGNYLDSAGTTAATVDNPVGLVLDAANGQLGSELVTNGDFSNGTTGWTAGNYSSTISNVAGKLRVTKTQAISYAANTTTYTVVPGKTYVGTVSTGSKTGAGNFDFRLGPFPESAAYYRNNTLTQNQSITFYFVATSTTLVISLMSILGESGDYNEWDNISVKEVTGIHAIQATTANKPILRRGAVNLLTYSQEISVARGYLTDPTSTLLINSGIAPDGTLTASKFSATSSNSNQYYYRASNGLIVGTIYTYSQYFKYDTGGNGKVALTIDNKKAEFDLITGVVVSGTGVISNVGNGWYRCSISITYTGANSNYATDNKGTFTQGQGPFVWGAQLQTGSVATDYIPTTTAPASSSTGNYWWQFDGSNDSLALGSVPFQVQDDHCVVAGGVVDSIASTRTISTFSAENATNVRAQFRIETSGAVRMYWIGSAGSVLCTSAAGVIVAGTPFVVSARRSGNSGIVRHNGAQKATDSLAALGTSASNVSQIGTYKGTEFFLGSLTPQIAIKGTVTDADLLTLEKWVGSLSGVTI